MEKWLSSRLSACLDFEVPNDMIKYIMSMKNSEELDEYFATLLNPEFDEHRMFMNDCKNRMFSKALQNKKANNQAQQPKNQTNTKKQEQSSSSSSVQSKEVPAAVVAGGGKKKKTKFVNLFTDDGKEPHVVMIKGRRSCDCEATQHNLINNCLNCGRIVCEQEGSGPCMFCGELVCTNEEMKKIQSSSKDGNTLKKDLEEKGGGEGLRKAMELRDRLLDYDEFGVKRTEVVDDEDDYFDVNSAWLTNEERQKFERLKQEMHDKRHAPRSQRAMKMDLFGREIVEEAVTEEYERKVREEITDTLNKTENERLAAERNADDDEYDTRVDLPKPVYTRVGPQVFSKHGLDNCTYNRVQDKQFLEMQDMANCLSMHQPYASLLVAGIKKHEGRVWYTNHRGRLWIASTAKEPLREEIDEVEQFYKSHYKKNDLKFPSQYQSGCLLGCVLVDDVLSQEEYRKKFPNGESDSPFVFICSLPQTLPVIFPIKGSHKIYKIDPKIHRTACVALLNANKKDKEKKESSIIP